MPGPSYRPAPWGAPKNAPRPVVRGRGPSRRIVSASQAPASLQPTRATRRSAVKLKRREKRISQAIERVKAAHRSFRIEGPGIDRGESKFYSRLAKQTGLSPRVLAAQGTQEGGADDDYNILNIGHTDSGDLTLTRDRTWQNPESAAKATAQFLKGKRYGASQGIRDILRSKGKSDSEQISAIARSGWATDPNYESGIRSIAPGIKVKPAKKPAKKDLRTLKKAGVDPKEIKSRGNPGKRPFRKAANAPGNAAKIIHPKWAPEKDFDTGAHGETYIAKGISPAVKKWSRKYDVDVGEAKADSGHVSPGHLIAGTATDVYPKQNTDAGWDKLERGLKVLEKMGFEVGYGTNGIGQAWPNHGRWNHAHIEWVGQGSSADAIKGLAGLTNAEIAKIEGGVGSGGSAGGGSAAAVGGSGGSGGSSAKKKKKKQKVKPRVELDGAVAGQEVEVSLSDLMRGREGAVI